MDIVCECFNHVINNEGENGVLDSVNIKQYIMIRKAKILELSELSGGKGLAEMHFIVSTEELQGSARTYAKIVLKPLSSIGWHQHIGEIEPYYILSGEGIFIDNDKSRQKVVPGDVCMIAPGQFHSIENPSSDTDLTFMALIYIV